MCVQELYILETHNSLKLVWVPGHCHLNGHLSKVGKASDDLCRLYNEEREAAQHTLCEFEDNGRKQFKLFAFMQE